MLNIITKETPIDEELKTRFQFICDFCNVKPEFINGSIRKIDKTNINYIEPKKVLHFLHLIIVKIFMWKIYKNILILVICKNISKIYNY